MKKIFIALVLFGSINVADVQANYTKQNLTIMRIRQAHAQPRKTKTNLIKKVTDPSKTVKILGNFQGPKLCQGCLYDEQNNELTCSCYNIRGQIRKKSISPATPIKLTDGTHYEPIIELGPLGLYDGAMVTLIKGRYPLHLTNSSLKPVSLGKGSLKLSNMTLSSQTLTGFGRAKLKSTSNFSKFVDQNIKKHLLYKTDTVVVFPGDLPSTFETKKQYTPKLSISRQGKLTDLHGTYWKAVHNAIPGSWNNATWKGGCVNPYYVQKKDGSGMLYAACPTQCNAGTHGSQDAQEGETYGPEGGALGGYIIGSLDHQKYTCYITTSVAYSYDDYMKQRKIMNNAGKLQSELNYMGQPQYGRKPLKNF